MNIHKDDKVKIMTGKDKGKTGKVLKAYPKVSKILVEGVNIVKRHVKPGTLSKEGGIVNIERPISVSNVRLAEPRSTQKSENKAETKTEKKVEAKAKAEKPAAKPASVKAKKPASETKE